MLTALTCAVAAHLYKKNSKWERASPTSLLNALAFTDDPSYLSLDLALQAGQALQGRHRDGRDVREHRGRRGAAHVLCVRPASLPVRSNIC